MKIWVHTFHDHLVHFVLQFLGKRVVSYFSVDVLGIFPFLVYCTSENLAALLLQRKNFFTFSKTEFSFLSQSPKFVAFFLQKKIRFFATDVSWSNGKIRSD
jgi:hypothetical protein